MSNMNFVVVSDIVCIFVVCDFGFFIDGVMQFVYVVVWFDVYDFVMGEWFVIVVDVDVYDVDCVVVSVRYVFDVCVWSGLWLVDCECILLKFVDLIEVDVEMFVQFEMLNQGKLIYVLCVIEVGVSVEYVCYMVGWVIKIIGQMFDVLILFLFGVCYMVYMCKELVGVVVVIVLWNFLLMIVVWKLVFVFVVGCMIVLKLLLEMLFIVLCFVEFVCEVGVLFGVFNVVMGGCVCGVVFVSYLLIVKILFMGLIVIGKLVGVVVVQNMMCFLLEFGGKNLIVMFDDVDVVQVFDGVVVGVFFNQGQVCVVVLCIYVYCSKFV